MDFSLWTLVVYSVSIVCAAAILNALLRDILDAEFVDVTTALCVFIINLIVIVSINKSLSNEYSLVKELDNSEVSIMNNEIEIDTNEYTIGNIYYTNGSYSNYLVHIKEKHCPFPGLITYKDNYSIVVNRDTNKLVNSKNKLSDFVELNKFILEVEANNKKDVEIYYDSSIKGIINNEKSSENESLENLDLDDTTYTDYENKIKDYESLIESQKKELDSKQEIIDSQQSEIDNLKNEVEKLKSTPKIVRKIEIDKTDILTIAISIIAISLIGVFIYGRVIKIRTNSKKELIITASDAKIREGVMLRGEDNETR